MRVKLTNPRDGMIAVATESEQGTMTTEPQATFRIRPRGPFSLAASTRFLEGFAPATYTSTDGHHLHLAFPVEGDDWRSAAVCVTQAERSSLQVEVDGHADTGAVRTQLERILSLHVDGAGWSGVGERDPVIGRLQQAHDGLRPVAFDSAYEAAAWALISHRIRITQAARIKDRIAQEAGERLKLHRSPIAAFPAPAALAAAKGLTGIPDVKRKRLISLGRAALDGRLDAGRLEQLGHDGAVDQLQRLDGIGPFSAELIVLRGVNLPDGLPSHELRLAKAVRLAYGLDTEPDVDEIAKLGEAWRPYRTWAAVLLRTHLEEQTGEIAGRTSGRRA